MNLSEPISLNNLREMAMLEALGLLDSVDESKFEESFGGLSPALQAELLDLQAAVAAEIAAAGDEKPDRALRYKVLARLASEIERDEVACGPIASIGSRTRRLAASASNARGVAEGEYGGVSTEHRLRRSAMIWRAAAFVLGSSLLALVVIQQQSLALSGRILELADSNIAFKGLVERLDENGHPTSEFEPLLRSTTQETIAFSGPTGGGACLVIVETAGQDSGTGMVLLFDMPRAQSIELIAIDRDDPSLETTLFRGDVSQFAASSIDLGGQPINQVRFELRDTETGEVLMSSFV
jgi:hypothetical protein